MSQDLIRATACTVVDKLRSGDVSPLELLDVLEKRISEVDGKVNALPTLCFDRARTNAKALMQTPAGAQGSDRRRRRADHAGLADLQG